MPAIDRSIRINALRKALLLIGTMAFFCGSVVDASGQGLVRRFVPKVWRSSAKLTQPVKPRYSLRKPSVAGTRPTRRAKPRENGVISQVASQELNVSVRARLERVRNANQQALAAGRPPPAPKPTDFFEQHATLTKLTAYRGLRLSSARVRAAEAKSNPDKALRRLLRVLAREGVEWVTMEAIKALLTKSSEDEQASMVVALDQLVLPKQAADVSAPTCEPQDRQTCTVPPATGRHIIVDEGPVTTPRYFMFPMEENIRGPIYVQSPPGALHLVISKSHALQGQTAAASMKDQHPDIRGAAAYNNDHACPDENPCFSLTLLFEHDKTPPMRVYYIGKELYLDIGEK